MSKFLKAIILKFFATKNQNNFDIKTATSILFLRYDRIGDMVITTPVFRELKTAYSHISISVLASKTNCGVLENNLHIDCIYLNDKKNWFKDLPILWKLRKQSFDVVVEFDHSVVPHAIFRLKIINPKKVISVKKDGRYGVDGRELSLYDFYTLRNDSMHFRDIWLHTLEPFGIIPKSNKYEVFPSAKSFDMAESFCKQFSQKLKIGINLEGSTEERKLDKNNFKKISKLLYENCTNIQIVLFCMPSKYEDYKNFVNNLNLDFVSLCYPTDHILDLCAIISKMDILISPDTSVVHIASSYNIPIISFFKDDMVHYNHFAPLSDFTQISFDKIDFISESFYRFIIDSFKKYLDYK
jgi:ADP-heptose:LPS heptosyltransferase